jgi:hypothetical protein
LEDAVAPIQLPSQSYLRDLFAYDPISGLLTWRTRPLSHFASAADQGTWNTKNAGKRAGTQTNRRSMSYWGVRIDGRAYLQHRIISVWMTGSAPRLVDHEDHDGLNNAWSNIRPADCTDNGANSRTVSAKKTGLPKGVYSGHGRYYAKLSARGAQHSLGGYATPEAAHAAYVEAAKLHFGEFWCAG